MVQVMAVGILAVAAVAAVAAEDRAVVREVESPGKAQGPREDPDPLTILAGPAGAMAWLWLN